MKRVLDSLADAVTDTLTTPLVRFLLLLAAIAGLIKLLEALA